MHPEYLLLRWQSRKVWTDPIRKVRTLESFAKTETDGGNDISEALKQVSDPVLLKHLKRHAKAPTTATSSVIAPPHCVGKLGVAAVDEAELDKPFDLTRGRESHDLDAHGFFRASLFDEMGEIAYIAMLHVAEKKAASLFRVHRDLTRDDPETCEIFEEILRDEKYHVAYTGALLKQWRQQGRVKEVKEALSQASGSRFLAGWKRFGLRAGAHFGQALLFVLYWTLLAPFGAIARKLRRQTGWQPPAPSASAGAPARDTRAQY